MNSTKNVIDPKTKAVVFLFVLLILGAIIGIAISKWSLISIEQRVKNKIENFKNNTKPWIAQQAWSSWRRYSDMYTIVTITICMNIMLLLGLTYLYLTSFKLTKSSFMVGLLIFLGVLLMKSLLNLPLTQAFLGQTISDIGIFDVVPNFFETIALIILYYISVE